MMAWSKALSKGTHKNKSIEPTDSDNKSSGSTTSDKSLQSQAMFEVLIMTSLITKVSPNQMEG